MKELRKQAAARRRRIIMNNDGNEVVYRCEQVTDQEAMAGEILGHHTSPLEGSQVDTIFYSDWGSGFGLFTHNSEVSEIFTTKEGIFEHNLTADLIAAGTDPLELMVDYCHQSGIEIFWSMRMNDVHDGQVQDGELYYPQLFPQFKRDHPEYLFGSQGEQLPGGVESRAWSAVDYGQDEVRERAFAIIEDVCRRYDIDGIELDFFRHCLFFKEVAHGEPLTQEHLDKMTELLQRVRGMADEIGAKRQRPILIAVRAPDSLGYCSAVGLDLETWLAQDLLDLLIPSGYFQLNPWEYSVELGHSYGVRVYPCLSESRVQGRPDAEWQDDIRNQTESMRARATNIWNSGADGVYLFNYHHIFKPTASIWRELGDPQTLQPLEKVYHVTVRGDRAVTSYLRDGAEFINVPTLSPDCPVELTAGEAAKTTLVCGEDLQDATEKGLKPGLRLRVYVEGLDKATHLHVSLNGRPQGDGALADGWLEFAAAPTQLQRGDNDIAFQLAPDATQPATIRDLQLWVTHD